LCCFPAISNPLQHAFRPLIAGGSLLGGQIIGLAFWAAALLDSFPHTNADGEVRQGIELIARRVTTLTQAYDSLLTVGLGEKIDLADYLKALCLRLPELQAKRKHPVQIVCETVPVLLGMDEVTALGMAVAELVTNNYGHAFPGREGIITFTVRHLGAGRAAIHIENNGLILVPQADSLLRGVGLVRLLLDRIDGTLEVDADNRTSWTLSFALAVPASGANAAA
jgi:two-component sensor histidine kinase